MGKPPTTDQELSARVEQLEQRADATDAAVAELKAGLDTAEADISLLIDRTDALDARVTALEGLVTVTPSPEPPDGTWGGVAPPLVDHTLPVPEPPQPATTGRSVTILLDGVSHLFTQEGGADLGAYHDPQGRFVQHCIAATNPEFPDFTVFFRPDAGDGGREEVVFEFGRCFGNPAGSVLGAYTATITLDGERLAEIDVPKHYFYSRWRWQSGPRPVIATAAELIAAKLVPAPDKTLATNRAAARTYAGPMDMAGLVAYFGTTGPRDELGVLTEQQADYLCYEDETGLTSILAQAEAAGTVPYYTRDEHTHAPLDFVNTYPNASSYGGSGDPMLPVYWMYEQDVQPDTAHGGSFCYIPFQVTGDPYFLEAMQFQTTFDYLSVGSPTDFCQVASLRAYAWHMRNIGQTWFSTPEEVPSWLQPKSYWRTYLDRALAWTMANCGPDTADPGVQRFRPSCLRNRTYNSNGERIDGEDPQYMEDYTMMVYLHMADLGCPGWQAVSDWKLVGCIDRCQPLGTNGWNRTFATVYSINYITGFDGEYHANWAEAYTWNLANNVYWLAPYVPDETGAHLSVSVATDIAQPGHCILQWASRRGVAEADAPAAWFRSEIGQRPPSDAVLRFTFA